MELYQYNDNSISIKDVSGYLDIRDPKWNSIFDFIVAGTSSFYFIGNRLGYSDDNLRKCIDSLAEEYIDVEANYLNIIIKLKPANLLLSRALLSELWLYYEYPAIIFLGEDVDRNEFEKICAGNVLYEEIAGSFNKIYLMHRNFEPDVLWIKKSPGMPLFSGAFI